MATIISSNVLTTTVSSSTLADPLGLTVRMIVGSIYATLAITALVLNILLVTIFVRYHAHYKRKAFFLITWQLIVGDVVTLTLQLTLAVPITYSGKLIYGNGWFIHLAAAFDTTAYYVIQFFNLIMAVYQASVFWSVRLNDYFFSPPKIYIVITCTYLATLIPVITQYAAVCYKEFPITGVYGYPTCSPLGKQVNQWWTWVKTVLPIFMIILYISIFVHLRCFAKIYTVRNTGNNISPKKENTARQIRLVIQCFLICGSLEVQNIISNNISSILSISDAWILHYIDFAKNGISILNTGIAPIVMFIFNNDIQSKLLELLRSVSWSCKSTFRMKEQMPNEITIVVVGNVTTRSTYSHFKRHSSNVTNSHVINQ